MAVPPVPSLYERVGGKEAVQKIVQKLYIRILTDPVLSLFFDVTRIDALKRSQTAFIMMALGGPHEYEGGNLRTAHAPLVARGMGDKHFDAVKHHLQGAMRELEIDAGMTDEALAIVETTRGDVLGR